MNSSSEMNYTFWLTRSQQATFNQLDGRLKNVLTQCFIVEGSHVEIASIALDIIRLVHKDDTQFRKKTERFFVHLLGRLDSKIHTALNKVLEITRQGFFDDFLTNVDTKKKTYHSPEVLISIVNEFHSHLPALLKQKENHQTIISHHTESLSSPSIQQAYEKLHACRTYFALPKLVTEFLTLLPSNQKWKQETYDTFFYLLNLTYNLKFDDFEKVELCKIIFCLHSPKRKLPFEYCSEIDIREFIRLCSDLKNGAGEEVLGYYFTSLNQTSELALDKGLKALNLLLSKIDGQDFYPFISQWSQQKFSLATLLVGHSTPTKFNQALFQDHIQNRLARFKRDPTVTQPLSDDQLDLIARQYEIIDKLCHEYKQLEFNQLMNLAHSIRQLAKQGSLTEENHLKLIAIGRVAIFLEFGIYPYSTQILALLGILVDGKSRQAQVKTGEGKSTIIALWAFVMAMECRAVDIITSARYLAIRDQEKFAKFFQRCGVTTSHICYDKKIPDYFRAQILYAPVFDFEFAWMGDLLWGSKLYQARLQNPYITCNFDAVMVDESDNLLIDSARNGARLAYPVEISYDWIYAPILSFVRANKDLVANDAIVPLRPFLSKHITEQQQKISERISHEQLKIWLESAHRALFELSLENDYVIKEKRDQEGHLNRTIQIVDLETGRISENSRWAQGVHEFLEVKHDIVVEKESLNPLSLSHAVFYEFYKTITALTGTAERLQTKEIYQIESFDVPPHHPLKRVDLPIIIAQTEENYYQLIVENIKRYQDRGRPLLVLCRSIRETRKLADFLEKRNISVQLLNEVQEELEQVVLSRAGVPRIVTIATNTAGRGTDILLTSQSLENGGLHVLLTFYPSSKRVEDQAIGRAGRQGQPGSSQIILNKESHEMKDLISREGRELTDREIVDLLNKQRKLKEKAQASVLVARAQLERFLAKKTHLFFNSFRRWSDHVEQESVLDRYAQKLCSIKLNAKKKLDFTSLTSPDLLLAEECKRLLTTKTEMLSWKVFLSKVIERLKKKVIQEWVKKFFEPAEETLMQTALAINSLKFQFEENFKLNLLGEEQEEEEQSSQGEFVLFALIGKHFLDTLNNQVEITKAEIDKEFDAYKAKWEEYLAPDGSGLFVYLKEIMDINFLTIIKK